MGRRGNGEVGKADQVPAIGGRFTDGDRTATFRAWADSLRALGVPRIAGDLIAADAPPPSRDASTNALIRRYRRARGRATDS